MRGPLDYHHTPPDRGWIASVLFWLCLLAAVALYGSVALAPKYLEHLELRGAHHAGQVRLVAIERQVRTLEKVAQALETDPAFIAELARIDLDAGDPAEERIAVAPQHRLDAPPAAAAPLPAATLPWHAPFVREFAESRALRRTLLVSAAAIVLAAFTLLHESRQGGRPFAWLGDRYRRDGK
ncbi:MAG: hypothetical protein WD069_02710 [Planctomycetales bacterium]